MNYLERIIDHKRTEVARLRRRVAQSGTPGRDSQENYGASSLERRDFVAALRRPGLSVIAEIKRRSPSQGILSKTIDIECITREYARGGAAALSVLTDRRFFGARPDDLQTARSSSSLPVLRKDFIIDPFQLYETRSLGADAVLLIAAVLSDSELAELIGLAGDLGLAALVEVHDEAELERAVACGATLIGINNRNLATFEIDLTTCLSLRRRIPTECIAVAESGIESRADVQRIEAAGFDAMLIGSALMRADDPAGRLSDLLVGGRLRSADKAKVQP